MPKRKKHKLSPSQTGLGQFVAITERMWCGVCKEDVIVADQDGNNVLLECGHATLRDLAPRLKEMHEWNMQYGWPNPDGGWYLTADRDYPGPNEMAMAVRHHPEYVDEIRKRMGPEWNPDG